MEVGTESESMGLGETKPVRVDDSPEILQIEFNWIVITLTGNLEIHEKTPYRLRKLIRWT